MRAPFRLLCLGAVLVGCSGITVVAPRAELRRVAPDDVPLPPFEPVAEGAESMNSEYCLESCAAEKARFAEFAKQIQELQKLQSGNRGQSVQRGFHGKAHGCLYGTVEPLPDRDPRSKFGVFAEGKGPYKAWIRFSNGVGWTQPDDELDARGMAVKLMGVEGARPFVATRDGGPDATGARPFVATRDGGHPVGEETQTQDFLMTNSPTPVGRNAEEFMKFAFANERGRLSGYWFAATHIRTGAPALMRTDPIDSAANAQYWAGGAFHLGAHQAVKYTAKPCEGSVPRPKGPRTDPDYLRKDLNAAAKAGLCFTFYAQFQADPKTTPIEHASREWPEDVAPPVPIATIRMPAQDLADPARDAFCEKLSYSPWHGIYAHQPMGHINRARRYVYEASRQGRAGGFEPHGYEGFDAPPQTPTK